MRALLLLLWTSVAIADSSITAARCTVEDGPLGRVPRAAGDVVSATAHHLLSRDGDQAHIRARASLRTVATLAGVQHPALVEANGKLLGILDGSDGTLTLREVTGKALWRAAAPAAASHKVALVAGDLLVVAFFPRIASGSSLAAFDLGNGTRRWQADVAQLHVPHSQYLNDVSLERDGDQLVLRGFEIGGCYTQKFALATGQRLSSTIASPPARCSMDDGPLARARGDLRGKRDRRTLVSVTPRHLLTVHNTVSSTMALVVERASAKDLFSIDHVLGPTLLEDASGKVLGILDGDLKQRDGRLSRRDLKGEVVWRAQAVPGLQHKVALVAGDLVVVGFYHPFATGSALWAFDLRTGAVRWRADVVQMNVDHSEYYNEVALELDGDRVVMRGFEAGGCYTQIFALASGQRLSSTIAQRK